MRLIRIGLICLLAVLLLTPAVWAQLSADLSSLSIVINLPSRTLELYSQDQLVKVYPVAIGKPSTPSPLGSYYIVEKEVDPWWYPPRREYAVPSGPDNPLGYRWMEFAPMYGIHGTNAPWAIGSAVSNGCIRMLEEDVEELFEVVPVGTPVRLTYDRIKVRKSAAGELSIGVYPDVYGWREATLDEAKRKLSAYGAAGFLSDDELWDMIHEEADQQIVIARLHAIRVNKKGLAGHAVTFRNAMYVPVEAVAAALGMKLGWDEQGGMVRGEKQSVPGRYLGGQLFVTADDARVLFGGQHLWNPEENCLDIDVLTIFLNGRTLAGDVQVIDGILAIPVLPLAEAIGQKVVIRPDGTYWVEGKKVPVSMKGDTAYLHITKIYEVFRAYVYWNQQAQSIELTYPFKVKGGGD